MHRRWPFGKVMNGVVGSVVQTLSLKVTLLVSSVSAGWLRLIDRQSGVGGLAI